MTQLSPKYGSRQSFPASLRPIVYLYYKVCVSEIDLDHRDSDKKVVYFTDWMHISPSDVAVKFLRFLDFQEYVSLLIGLYKYNVSLSHVAIRFLFI